MDRGAASALFDRPDGRHISIVDSRNSRALSDMMGQGEWPLHFLHIGKWGVELSAQCTGPARGPTARPRVAARRQHLYPLPHMFSLHFYDARARRDRWGPPSQR